MTSPNDVIVIYPDAPPDDLDGDLKPEYPLEMRERTLSRLRGNRVVELAWNEYQNQLLADGKYAYGDLYLVDSLCTLDAWDQAHKQDRVVEAWIES